VLNLEARAGTPAGARTPPHYRILRPNTFARYRAARFAIETEYPADRNNPHASILVLLQKPMSTGGNSLEVEQRVTLYLPHVSVEAELNDRKLAGALVGKCALYALDVRGMGESMSVRPPESNFFAPYQFDYMHHGHGILLGQSFLGRRVFDVLRTMDLLVSAGAQRFDLIGRGQGALLAAFAAVLCPQRVRSVTLRNGPVSFLEWATVPVVKWPAANFPRGVLAQFDLPDLYRVLKGRLKIVEPWNAEMKPAKGRRA
jgi:pimeloyl-ACP methyl ester carboxylesterase